MYITLKKWAMQRAQNLKLFFFRRPEKRSEKVNLCQGYIWRFNRKCLLLFQSVRLFLITPLFTVPNLLAPVLRMASILTGWCTSLFRSENYCVWNFCLWNMLKLQEDIVRILMLQLQQKKEKKNNPENVEGIFTNNCLYFYERTASSIY